MRRLYFLPLLIVFALLGALLFVGSSQEKNAAILAQTAAAFAGAAYCAWALKLAGGHWSSRLRSAWIFIALSGVAFGLGCLFKFHGGSAAALKTFSLADGWWVIQQPLLWIGLCLLAWRGQRFSMVRLLTDNLIVVLAALVLSWNLLLEHVISSEHLTDSARLLALYYPLSDIAHLFCALILLSNVRDRPALARAARWLVLGVLCLISADSLSHYFFMARGPGRSIWLDIMQGSAYLFVGASALIHANLSVESARATPSQEMAIGDENASQKTVMIWERTLGRWHRSAMLWLPYAATLGVSAVLVAREMREANPTTIQRLLPVLALLLAIVARQMITLWDNIHLSEQLRARAVDLEQNVDERTRHLTTLHGITSTFNTSLDKRTVLRITLEQTMTAVGAQCGGIWLRDVRHDSQSVGATIGNASVMGASDAGAFDADWTMVHWLGQDDDDPAMPEVLREISIADATLQGESNVDFNLSPAARAAITSGLVPPKHQLIQVPVASQGELLGVMALARSSGKFSYEDRALVESVALEAGTALQNARLYSDAAERANRDSVTKLFNHRAVQEQLHTMLALAKRTGGCFSLVMMDLNNFKFFNDTYGHPVGDKVLREVASALREASRATDVLGRYGGDEFIMLLPHTDAPGALEACARIRNAMDARSLEPVPGTKLPISIAFGWSNYPSDGETVLELLTAADQHLYDHKRGNASRLISSAKNADQDAMRRLKNRAVGGSFGVLDALVTAIDNKDHYTRHHSEEVTYLSLLVARELGHNEQQLEAVRISGLLHDVGKIAVPDDVLRHPGKLSREQWEIMQQHPVFGALIVKDVPHLDAVSDGIKYHHEKWDGNGYPESLVGENIPLMGRLLAMADCYSALTTDRPYRKGWTPQAALEEIARCAGTHFDPRLCAVFLRVMERELNLDADTSDYSARIADDFGQLARLGQTKSSDPIVARETVPREEAGATA